MGLYSLFKGREDEAPTPEQQAAVLAQLRHNCLLRSPSTLFRSAEIHHVLPALLEKTEDIDDVRYTHIINSYLLMTQLEQLMIDDDGDKLSDFLIDNLEFVISFPHTELFEQLCWLRPSPACVAAFLKSPLRDHVDVNRFRPHQSTPLQAAITRFSLPLTDTLLLFGADPHAKCGRCPTALSFALDLLRWDKLPKNMTLKQTTIEDFFNTLSDPTLEDVVHIIYRLAYASFSDLERMLTPIVFGPDLVDLILLLVIAQPILLCPSGSWSLEKTLASGFLSNLRCDDDDQEKRKHEALAIVKSVWEASEKLCQMQFDKQSHVFPSVMQEFYEQYADARIEALGGGAIPRAAKRARN